MKPSDIVLIRFPQADLKSGKLRPALIMAISTSRHHDLGRVLNLWKRVIINKCKS